MIALNIKMHTPPAKVKDILASMSHLEQQLHDLPLLGLLNAELSLVHLLATHGAGGTGWYKMGCMWKQGINV